MGQNTQFNWITTGHVGDIGAYERRDGRVIYRIRHNIGGKGIKSLLTQEHRLLMPNIMRAAQKILPFIHNAFCDRKPGESDVNAFVSANYGEASVYLTRKDARLGACVVDNFVVSQGPLDPIELELRDGKWVSNICIGDLQIDAQTTVSQLAWAVVNNNRDGRFEVNDNLHLMRMTQYYDSMDLPRAEVSCVKFNLVSNDETRLLDYFGTQRAYGLEVVTVDGRRYLAFDDHEGSVVTYILARKRGTDSWVTSTQQLRGSNAVLDDYSGPSALYDSIESYGGLNTNNWYQTGTTLDPLQDLMQEVLGDENGSGSTGGTQPGGGSGTGSGSDPTEEEPGGSGGGDQGGSGGSGGNEGGGDSGGQTPSTVEITVACTPAGGGTPNGSGSYTPGSEAQISITPSLNWNFIQWNDGDTSNPRTITVPSENTTYTATMQLNV